MIRDAPPALDAEKAGKEQLLAKFRPPPDITESVTRSTLLVGTRGSGKTMFLRRCRHLYSGLAFYGDLRKILNPISSDTGAGGLSFDAIPPSLEPAIQTKTIALLATWLAEQASERDVTVPIRALQRAIPPEIRSVLANSGDRDFDALQSAVRNCDLTALASDPSLSSFLDFAAALSEACQEKAGSLLILLDRAEEIPYPCLTPVLNLLDQTHSFLAIVAARPGILGPDQLLASNTPTPGDHFDIRQLGSSPYSKDWKDFQLSAIEAWIPDTLARIPAEELELLFRLSRDSIRHTLEIVYNSIDDTGAYKTELANKRVELLKTTLLSAAQGKLRALNGDIKELIAHARRSLGVVDKLPILLQLESGSQRSLTMPHSLRDMPKHERFVRLALRTGFFSVKDGDTWHPYSRLDEVEISPIFIWKEGDPWWPTP